jgi:hypothetical protein
MLIISVMTCVQSWASGTLDVDSLVEAKIHTLERFKAGEIADTSYETTRIIHFLRNASDIKPSTSGQFYGYDDLTETDLNNYKDWFIKNKGKLDQEVILREYNEIWNISN